ncbi:hypothetical protein FDK38_005273 [Candidozyma auris]|nr:hypothetical protein FDK38_005273 [[Candida] auris]
MTRIRHSHSPISPRGSTAWARATVLLSSLLRMVHGFPIPTIRGVNLDASTKPRMTAEEFYANLFTSVFLVLAGGVFAGLTLGLMGQDEVYLKVIATSGDPSERKYARKVLRLIGRGKHWVLVTLLLSNVITNETLPIVLDRCLGGGWPAVVTSTASIVIFGEIIPQSICVRYGLQVGALFAPFVLVLMYVMYPVAYPCSLLLDHILGEDHGTVYKKSGLKTLVTLHKTMGVERLNQDEVTIISAVLDLKEKTCADIMTPMDCVYTMSSDSILDEKTVEEIFNAGFSRIPIHLPNEPSNFIGMLLVRVLISYDPEDALPVASFPLATLPETAADTSCLNILNYFQEGKSHMIVVSETPGEPTGALGVLTLEDVIEELIGEEIVDESDVYIDINKNIKRSNPGPLSRRHLTQYLHTLYQSNENSKRNSIGSASGSGQNTIIKANPVTTSPNIYRANAEGRALASPMLAPMNRASNPLETSKSYVTIKKPLQQSEVPGSTPTSVGNSVPGPARSHPQAKGSYEPIYTSESAALEEARQRVSNDNSQFKEDGCSNDRDGHGNNHYHNNHRSKGGLPTQDRRRNDQETDISDIAEERDKSKKSDKKEGPSTRSSRSFSRKTSRNGSFSGGSNSRRGSDAGDHYDDNGIDHSDPISMEFSESRSYRTGGIVESVVNVQGVHKTIIEDISDSEESSPEHGSLTSQRKKRYSSSEEETQRLVNF